MSFIDRAFGIYPEALIFRSQRSTILAANIANSDTPGFKARDYDFRDALKTYGSGKALKLKTTNARHANSSVHGQYGGLLYRVPTKDSSNGHTVESEVEQAAFYENAVHYKTTFRFLNGVFSVLKLSKRDL